MATMGELEEALRELRRTRTLCELTKGSPESDWQQNDRARSRVDDLVDALTDPIILEGSETKLLEGQGS